MALIALAIAFTAESKLAVATIANGHAAIGLRAPAFILLGFLSVGLFFLRLSVPAPRLFRLLYSAPSHRRGRTSPTSRTTCRQRRGMVFDVRAVLSQVTTPSAVLATARLLLCFLRRFSPTRVWRRRPWYTALGRDERRTFCTRGGGAFDHNWCSGTSSSWCIQPSTFRTVSWMLVLPLTLAELEDARMVVLTITFFLVHLGTYAELKPSARSPHRTTASTKKEAAQPHTPLEGVLSDSKNHHQKS